MYQLQISQCPVQPSASYRLEQHMPRCSPPPDRRQTEHVCSTPLMKTDHSFHSWERPASAAWHPGIFQLYHRINMPTLFSLSFLFLHKSPTDFKSMRFTALKLGTRGEQCFWQHSGEHWGRRADVAHQGSLVVDDLRWLQAHHPCLRQ